ncbi:MAG: undecaprenyl/decaprenyl-phosphate alpha-N-acetylglucosaminyl 1-phosphate transferase [Bacteroidales bacterium]|nr:undecaprenyl/decaprenyl-phosphate alpha-N-acetylglucosaminyl 1-phosphate transferase [Bacteroidales bacterium]
MKPTAFILTLDFLAAAFLEFLVIELLLVVTYKRRLFDVPNARKVHSIPVPRLGGVTFLPVMMITVAVTVGMMYHLGLTGYFEREYYVLIQLAVLLGSGMLMYIVGVADDLVEVDYRFKLVFQFISSCVVVLSGLWIKDYCGLFGIHELRGIIGMPVSVILIIYIINSINMIDGIDGLSSGIGALSLVTLTSIAFAEGHFLHMVIGITLLGILTVFWLFNMFGSREKCTKVFMGDSGSLTLGLFLSFLIINVSDFGEGDTSRNLVYLSLGFSTLMIPMLDVPRLVIWRLIHRRSPFLPDNNHIHHLLMRCGLSQHGTLGTLLGVDVVIILLTFLLVQHMSATWVLCIDMLVWYGFTGIVLAVLSWKERVFPSIPTKETEGH